MSDADQRSYHHGDLRQALLDRAAEVIQSRGIEALTLRGLARDLKVSHGAPNRHFSCKADLLTAIATEGYSQLMRATLSAANDVGDDPWVRLNAMGQGFVHWALNNTAQFNTTMHPDLSLYESAELKQATEAFRLTIKEAVAATKELGNHSEEDLETLNLFTISVPMGAAMLLTQKDGLATHVKRDKLVADLIELVVPIRNRTSSLTQET
jgi:AcrR family transcriptional regulator